jgi:flagellar basal-body rod protein FlgC
MYGALDISTSGLTAQRMRMTAISANIANRNTILDENGEPEPYRARRVLFAPGDPSATSAAGRKLGVHVADVEVDQSSLQLRFDPGNPLAFKSGPRAGYVAEPNVNPVVEQMNAFEASRAYEANIVAAEATKTMIAQALRLLA